MASLHPARFPELQLASEPRQENGSLPEILHRVFGHREFRPHQQAVCEAAAAGSDVLLVMPTGAGKSLCYQLPALARGGTALVISPLIALMDDQAAKLEALNLRVARIHSGLPRESAREAARAYLEGRLDFLFIAPERLRVPGFPEMLARRKPALIAVDEAHCISQWGHDFRPDYRTLSQFLPALRPSPIIALTATATPSVQTDIVRALGLQEPSIFITGFRRTNLHIEATEVSKPQRTERIRTLLADQTSRPAIVYAQSRKSAEEIASSLAGKFTAAPYHAGLDAGTRDRVQRAFLSGKLDVVVATVAFGMGIDKADVRTVIHAALPGSVEAYYQEIGRAGRDGKPSRAVLLHSFADRRTQEFFLERSYPALSDIEKVLGALAEGGSSLSLLQQQLKLDLETLEQCVDKLLVQGAVAADLDGSIHAVAQPHWKQSYERQVQYRRSQIDKIVAFAEGTSCRMAALVRHFGDLTDTGTPCGICDICQPEGTASNTARPPNDAERTELRAILKLLGTSGRSSGKILSTLGWQDRRYFDALVNALARAGLVSITTETFRAEDGRDITYRKLALTPDASEIDDRALDTVWLRPEASGAAPAGKRRAAAGAKKATAAKAVDPLTQEQTALEARLKQWRLATATAQGVPAFTVFHDSVLRNLAINPPANVAELEAVRGIGQEKSNRYAADLLALSAGREPADPPQRKPQPITPRSTGPQLTLLTSREREVVRDARNASPPKPKPVAHPLNPVELSSSQQQLEKTLRNWRSEQAAAAGLPSFFVLSDTALRQVAATQPGTLADLGRVSGIGTEKLERYGAALLQICQP